MVDCSLYSVAYAFNHGNPETDAIRRVGLAFCTFLIAKFGCSIRVTSLLHLLHLLLHRRVANAKPRCPVLQHFRTIFFDRLLRTPQSERRLPMCPPPSLAGAVPCVAGASFGGARAQD